MIAYLKGNILAKENDHIIIEVNGVGYQVYMNEKTMTHIKISEEKKFYTYQHVREDDLSLFGFDSLTERQLFLALTSVSGVGPKAGMAFLSAYSVEKVVGFIARGDIASLTSVPGIGKKGAERIVLELKEKILSLLPEVKIQIAEQKGIKGENDAYSDQIEQGFRDDLYEAMSSLGYSTKEIDKVLNKNGAEVSDCENVEEAIKVLLKSV